MSLRLLPVVEFEPYRYSPSRAAPGIAAPAAEWERYWRDCLADAGITDLSPLQPGSWFVPVREISQRPDVLLGAENPQDSDEILAFPGGLAVMGDDRVLVTPQCCGDLQDLDGWWDLLGSKESATTTLWIGHPSLIVHHRDRCFSMHREDEPDRYFTAAHDELVRELRSAEAVQTHLASALMPLLPHPRQALGCILAGVRPKL